LDKIKVFALAKKLGFKSAEFLELLHKVGYPVKSYQASLEEWDIPIIEQRLRQGGLLRTSSENDENASEGENEKGGVTWDALAKQSLETQEDESLTVETPSPTEESPTEYVPEPQKEEPTEGPTVTSVKVETPEPAEADSTSPTPTPAPAPATAQAPVSKPAKDKVTPPSPSPKPRRAATKLGKIDLEKLGLIKSQHQKGGKGSTFTEVRDRESARLRDRRAREREKLRARRQGKVGPKNISTVDRKKNVALSEPVNVKSFSEATGIPSGSLLRDLMKLGVMATINAVLDRDTVELLADHFSVNIEYKEEHDIEQELMKEVMEARKTVDEASLKTRPPVIAFLGHVDHGKTTLVDAIRTSRIAGKEAGGITQHIGAYTVEQENGRSITVLDTPGHAAFTAMRARGAKTTDIVVIVVAADDGVMPQTEEAIAHAKEAGCPIVVAINKVDIKGANPEQVKSQLSGLGLQAEDWGGEVGMIEVSALKKQGVQELLERILLEAEILDSKAHAKGDAMGTILEAKVEKGKGKVVHVLVQDGTLQVKDVVLAGHTFGKVRLMFDHNGKPTKSAGPSTPVEVLGLDDLPTIGEPFYVVKDLKSAKAVAEKRLLHRTELDRANKSKVTLHNVFEKLDESMAKRMRFIIKADVQGSLEVLKSALMELSSSEVLVEFVHTAVGAVTESDVLLASTADAIIVAFHIAPDSKARKLAERERVEIRRYNVIYELLEDVEKALVGMLSPDTVEEVIGSAEVLEVFTSSRWGTIAGCRILKGLAKNTGECRIIRDGKTVAQVTIDSLRHFKDDVKEVKEGKECGIKLENFDDIKAGDMLELIEHVEKARSLEDAQTEEKAESVK